MRKLLFSSLLIFSFFLLAIPSYAHQSGCHRWHSCPSDSGSYVCGDWGYCSGCPDNEYCKNRQPITSNVTINITPSSQPSSTPSDLISIPSTNITCRGTFQGIVERIIDGDTLVIKGCDKNIRFSLVNTPEKNELGYTEAKDFVSNLCANSTAVIDEDDGQKEGSYGRIVAVVYCQNKNINAELLSNNLGKIDTRFCSKSEFGREDWAKKYGCDTKINTISLNKTSLPNASINSTPVIDSPKLTTTYSSNISTNNSSEMPISSKPAIKEVDKTVLLDVLFGLEQVKIKLDGLKNSALAISEYYSEKGDATKTGNWYEISNSFNGVINSIDGITAEIKQNKDSITADFIQKIKGEVGGVKADISSVIDKVIEVM